MMKRLNSIPKVEVGLCMELEGKSWKVGATLLHFQQTEKRGKIIVVPFPSGIEAYAFRVLDQHSKLHFLKLYKKDLKHKRLRRLEWLIAQEIWSWDASFRGAPRMWISTQTFGRPHGIDRDFGGVLLSAVPGSSWHSWKTELESGKTQWSDHIRTSLARQLIRSLAVLERAGITHGDISDNNVLIDVEGDNARLFVIDFDGFVLRTVEKCSFIRRWCIKILRYVFRAPFLFDDALPSLDSEYRRLTVSDDGTVGTRNYASPELMKAFDEKRHDNLAPTTDLHARDVVLVELLCWGKEDCRDESPLEWSHAACKSAGRIIADSSVALSHLVLNDSLELDCSRRPTSLELAETFGILLPAFRQLREVTPDGETTTTGTGSPRKQTPLQKAGSLAFLLFVIFLVYRFNIRSNSNDSGTSDPILRDQPADTSEPTSTKADLNTTTEIDVGGIPTKKHLDLSELQNDRSKDAAAIESSSAKTGELAVPPVVSTPKPQPDPGYTVRDSPVEIPGWRYLRTYKNKFLCHIPSALSKRSQSSRIYVERDYYSGFDLTADGSRLGVLRSDGEGCVVDTITNEITEHIHHGGFETYRWGKLDLSPDGSFVALGRDLWGGEPFPKAIITIDYATPEVEPAVIKSPTMDSAHFAVDRTGKIVAFPDGEREATVMNLETSSRQTIRFPASPSEFSQSKVGFLSISDDGSLVAMGRYESAPKTVEVAVFATDTLERIGHELREVQSDYIFIPKCTLSANGEYLFVYRPDENRFQCTHLPTKRVVYSPDLSICSGYSVVEPSDAAHPIVYGFRPDVLDVKAALIIWNPSESANLVQHELSGEFETIIVSSNGAKLAMLHRDSGTVSLYEAE